MPNLTPADLAPPAAPLRTQGRGSLERLLPPGLAARLDRLDLVSRKVFAGKLPGERRSKRRGRSVEFDDHRNYVPGDDLRHIDWNVLARHDRFFLKLFREDQDLALHLLVDASESMNTGDPNKRLFAARLAMALGYIGLVNQNRVVLTVFHGPGRALTPLAPVRGRTNAARLADVLIASLDPRVGAPNSQATRDSVRDVPGVRAMNFNAALRSVAQHRSGRGVLVVISDFLHREGHRAGLDFLAGALANSFDTFVFHTLAPGELDPAADRLIGDVRLTDIESGDSAEVTVSAAVLNKYRAALAAFRDELRSDCRARGIDYQPVLTSTPIDEFVLSTLRKGGVLR